jgi:hypothetical protein
MWNNDEIYHSFFDELSKFAHLPREIVAVALDQNGQTP